MVPSGPYSRVIGLAFKPICTSGVRGKDSNMSSYQTYKTVKIVGRVNVYGQTEYQVQEFDGFALSEWLLIDAAREQAASIDQARTSPEFKGWGGLELS